MTRRVVFLLAIVSVATLSFNGLAAQSTTAGGIRAASPEVLATARSIYQYNHKVLVLLDTVATIELQAYVRQKLVIRTALQPPVPAWLAIPHIGPTPFPLIILVHAYSASKDAWLEGPLVDSLVGNGFAVLALDAPYHGERSAESGYRLPPETDLRDVLVRWTIEHRRALDVLSTRKDLDTTRLGVLGYSMGTLVSFALAGVDERVKVVVAAVTPVGVAKDPEVVTVAPQTFATAVRVPLLMLMGKTDHYYTMDEARQLFNSIGEARKELYFYDSGHGLPPQWTARATAWLLRYLK